MSNTIATAISLANGDKITSDGHVGTVIEFDSRNGAVLAQFDNGDFYVNVAKQTYSSLFWGLLFTLLDGGFLERTMLDSLLEQSAFAGRLAVLSGGCDFVADGSAPFDSAHPAHELCCEAAYRELSAALSEPEAAWQLEPMGMVA